MSLHYESQFSFSNHFVRNVLDPKHRLVILADRMEWAEINGRLRGYYSLLGRRALPIRLMVGLLILKHMENMSDEQAVDRIRGDLYWMHFCGVDVEDLNGKFSHLDRTSLTKFRNRIGQFGMEEVEDVIREYLVDQNQMDPREMTTDSTCMEKNIGYPTDSSLLNKGRVNLLKAMGKLEQLGVDGVQGLRKFSRKSKRILIGIMKLGKDRADRIREGTLELASQAVHVKGKAQEMLENAEHALKNSSIGISEAVQIKGWIHYLKEQSELMDKVIHQARQRFKGRHVAKKIYSLHEPQVVVIRKGKGGKVNEYGCKANISIDSNGYIMSHEIHHHNRHDSKILDKAIDHWKEKAGEYPVQLNADRGYNQKKKSKKRIKQIKRVCIPRNGKKKHPDSEKTWFKKGFSKRAGVEAVIGHLKTDHRLDRCRYKGCKGDEINLSLAAVAWNLKKYSRRVA